MLCFKYPTKIVFIDDDTEQLESLQCIFEKTSMICSYVSSNDQIESMLRECDNLEPFQTQALDVINQHLLLSCRKLQNYKNNNIYYTSVVIADYKLAGALTGLDVLDKIDNKNIFKIMYTGVADENIAVHAFNRKQINGYFKKSNKISGLLEMIEAGLQSFFQNISDPVIKLIKEKTEESALLHVGFHLFFSKFLIRNKIVEFYLIDSHGSFLLVDKEQQIYTLLVMPISTITAQTEILEEEGMGIVANAVLNKTKMLYINDLFDRDYRNLVFPCNVFKQSKEFMVSFVKGNVLGL